MVTIHFPIQINEIKNAMVKLYNSPDLRNDLVAKGKIRKDNFSWDKTANLLWNSIEKAVK